MEFNKEYWFVCTLRGKIIARSNHKPLLDDRALDAHPPLPASNWLMSFKQPNRTSFRAELIHPLELSPTQLQIRVITNCLKMASSQCLNLRPLASGLARRSARLQAHRLAQLPRIDVRRKSGPYGYTQAKALVFSKNGEPSDVLK